MCPKRSALCAAFSHSFGTYTPIPLSIIVLIVGADPPPVDALAALWAQLQLKHTQEAAAASMSRKASAEHQIPRPAVAQQELRNVGRHTGNAANVPKSQIGPVTSSKPHVKASDPVPGSSTVPQQQSSEESFWNMMQQ